jgi:hypothetical protein
MPKSSWLPYYADCTSLVQNINVVDLANWEEMKVREYKGDPERDILVMPSKIQQVVNGLDCEALQHQYKYACFIQQHNDMFIGEKGVLFLHQY